MVIVKGSEKYEAGGMPDEALLAKMGQYNEELVKAGIMQAGEGIQPSSKGYRIQYTDSKPKVIDGPFTEAKELVAGFWIWKVKSMNEALDWAKRAPFAPGDAIELRPIFEAEDFREEFTPELREKEDRLRAQMEKK